MKSMQIREVLDLAFEARKQDLIFNPLFTGDAGLAKSFQCKAWAKEKQKQNPNFGFIDLRIAYMEAPDLIGFPKEVPDEQSPTGFKTIHCLPDFWPREGEGLLLLEEPNRGTIGVMNCLMQLLTDRTVHKYILPKGWVVAACINPESAEYAVNNMDAALKNRFEEFEIDYDHNSFVEFIEEAKWHAPLVSFIKSGAWVYKSTKELAKGATYISPRTLEKINNAEKSGLSKNKPLHFITARGTLGKDVGKAYHKFCFEEAPITYNELLENKEEALNRLKKQCKPGAYQGDMVGITVESISKNFIAQEDDDITNSKIGEKTMADVCAIIPADQGVNLLKSCAINANRGNVAMYLKHLVTKYPHMVDLLKASLAADRAQKK